MKKTISLLFIGLTVLFISGCASKPVDEMASAQQALGKAMAAEADVYAPEALRELQDTMKEAEAEIAAQDDTFFLSRSYEKATQLLTEVANQAEEVVTTAEANKEKAEEEAKQAMASAETAIAEVKDLLAKAPRGKGTKADLEALAGDLAGAETAFSEASLQLSEQKYLGARDQFNAVLERMGAIRTEIETAMAARRRR